jgi:hypothetical protein
MSRRIVRFEVLTAVTMKMALLWAVARVDWYQFTDGSEVCTASIIRAISG